MHHFPRQQEKKIQKNVLIGHGDWLETPVFYVSDFQMSFGKKRLSLWRRGFGEKKEGRLLARAQIEMMHCSPSLRLELTVIKCLIVASWEFVLNISYSVMIIWVWVGRGCNHLGWLFDEILDLVVVLSGHFKCPSGIFTLLNVHAVSSQFYPTAPYIAGYCHLWFLNVNFVLFYFQEVASDITMKPVK